jgi:HEAT repeat protein
MWSLEQWGVNSETDLHEVGFLFRGKSHQSPPKRTPGTGEYSTMGEQLALLSTLDYALDYFRRIQRERNEALAQLKALEQEVNILKVLTPLTRTRPAGGMMKYCRPVVGAVTVGIEGLYNHGYRDRALIWLAATLRQSPDPDLRRWAAFALGVMGDSRPVPALASALNDDDKAVRRQATAALGRIGTAHVVTPLAAALKDGDRGVREKAIEALGKVGEPAIRLMITGLRAPDALVRRGSSDALARIGGPAVSPLTRSLLEEDDALARIGAVETLGKMRDERAAASLVVALMDLDSDIQDTAAQALVRTGKPAVVPLVRVLRVAGNPFRRRVAEVLARTRSLAVKPLIDVLGDENAEVRLAASEALVKMGKPALGSLRGALKDPKPGVRLEAATALGLIGDQAAVNPLIQAMKGRDRELRQRAAKALVRIGRPAAAPLVSLFKDADASVREQASQALVEIGRPAFEPLCAALQEADFGTRWEAAQVLGRLRSSGHLRGLHGKWERIVDETMLLAWFNSGWAQGRTNKTKSHDDSKCRNPTAILMQRLPSHRKRGLG